MVYFTMPFDKNGKHGLPESHAGRNERQHEIQSGKSKANRNADREALKKMMDTNQERMNVKLRKMKEEIKCGQAEMKPMVSAIEEKMEAAIHSMGSELRETVRHRTEGVVLSVDQTTHDLRKELTETQVELQELTTSVDMRTENFQEVSNPPPPI
jgi:hypothetical protein